MIVSCNYTYQNNPVSNFVLVESVKMRDDDDNCSFFKQRKELHKKLITFSQFEALCPLARNLDQSLTYGQGCGPSANVAGLRPESLAFGQEPWPSARDGD